MPGPLRWLLLALVLGAAAGVVVTRLNVSYDLAFFLPRAVTDAQRVMIDRAGQGPGSQLLFVVLPGAPAAARDALAEALRTVPGVRRTLPGAGDAAAGSIPRPVLENRYLLADVDLSVAGLRTALTARLADLASVDDPGFLELVAADPQLVSLSILESLTGPPATQAFQLDDGTPYVIVDATEPAFDLGAQQQLVARIDAAAATAYHGTIEIYGAGAYGLRLQTEVRRESTWFSVTASLALIALLWITYRSVRAPLLAAVPLGAGAMTGLAALALAFPAVHGITLAFGFTLLGVTVDYAMHVMSHARGGRGAAGMRGVWPTLALSVASSALAFLAFTVSGSRGLAQLGVFSATGIVVAGGFAWLLLPRAAAGLPAAPENTDDSTPVALRLRGWPWLLAAIALAATLWLEDGLWNDDLSTLTPVPADVLEMDRRLRVASGAPDMRYLVMNRATTERSVLLQVSAATEALDTAVAAGRLDGYRSVTRLVPDPVTQARRRQALAVSDLPVRLTEAAAGLPLRAGAFAPFLAAVQRSAADAPPVTAASYRDTELASVVGAMLYREPEGWVALTYLQGLTDPAALGPLPTGSELVDLRGASESLLATYRSRLLEVLAAALVVVALALALALRDWRRWIWVLGTMLTSLAATIAVTAQVLGSLSLFDLVAATLVAGLGLDYALFFSRRRSTLREQRDTGHALIVCFASTAVVFGLLATSSIPVLGGIGTTVLVGVAVAYGLALAGRSARPGS